jgi:site-specific recombinase XerD
MKSASPPTFPQIVQGYFCQNLINQKNASQQTVASYRDTMRLLLCFLKQHLGREPSRLNVSDLNADNVELFLNWLEQERGNAVRTRNNRFAAVRSFLRYAAARDPVQLPLVQRVLAMPMKRFDRPLMDFLLRDEVQAVLDAPDASTWSGRRDRVMFAVLYNTGARVSEIARLKIEDADLDHGGSIRLYGKGRKERTLPLWKDTIRCLKTWLSEIPHDGQKPLFPNATGGFLTRSGIESRLKRAVTTAAAQCASLKNRHVSPHTIRHSIAMHLLQSGTDITVIALWLGHENPATTHMYVEADLAMKQKALDRLDEPGTKPARFKPDDALLQFLEGL